MKANESILARSNLFPHTDQNTIRLTLMEAKLLRHLIHNKGRNVYAQMDSPKMSGLPKTRTRAPSTILALRLRKYIAKKIGAEPRHLLTVRGVGYRFVA